jgi:hypothetical protein
MRFLAVIFVAAAFYLIAAISGQAAPIEGLVLYLPFDEGEGDTAQDLSGKENHGALMGKPEWVAGKAGSALQFNGEENSNYVEVPDHPSLNPASEITCAAWIYFDEFHPSCGIISKYIGAGNQRTYNMHMGHTDALSISANCSSDGVYKVGVSTTTVTTPGDTLKAGEWQHVAMTFKATEFLRIYVNGELKVEADASATDSLFDNDAPLLVGTDFEIGGAHGGTNPREFTGIIDEVAVFNRALSEDEIRTVMGGVIASVESYGKLTITWGAIKEL